jgi:hypothetical protein
MRNTETTHQVPRSTMADAEKFNRLYLIKNVKKLRATYQIRMLTYRAVNEGLTLVLKVPFSCEFQPSLLRLVKKTGSVVLRENL